MTDKPKILITGAAGFIGSHLARKCVEEGYDVHILLRPSSDTSRIKDVLPKITTIYGDLRDGNSLKIALDKIKPKGIFHLATSTIMSGIMASPEEIIETNFLGTVNLINSVDDTSLDFFVNTGSFLEYAPQNRALKELDPCEPGELYSISKLSATLYAKAISRLKKLPVVTIRIFTPYGPGIQKGRLVYEIIRTALENNEINLTAPTVSRDFIFVKDIVDLYLKASLKAKFYSGEIFNAGSGSVTNLDELSRLIIGITGSKSKVIWGKLPLTTYDTASWQADMTKTSSSFSWHPLYDLVEGLNQTLVWYRGNKN